MENLYNPSGMKEPEHDAFRERKILPIHRTDIFNFIYILQENNKRLLTIYLLYNHHTGHTEKENETPVLWSFIENTTPLPSFPSPQDWQNQLHVVLIKI